MEEFLAVYKAIGPIGCLVLAIFAVPGLAALWLVLRSMGRREQAFLDQQQADRELHREIVTALATRIEVKVDNIAVHVADLHAALPCRPLRLHEPPDGDAA